MLFSPFLSLMAITVGLWCCSSAGVTDTTSGHTPAKEQRDENRRGFWRSTFVILWFFLHRGNEGRNENNSKMLKFLFSHLILSRHGICPPTPTALLSPCLYLSFHPSLSLYRSLFLGAFLVCSYTQMSAMSCFLFTEHVG